MLAPEKSNKCIAGFLSVALATLSGCGGEDHRADAIDDFVYQLDPFATDEPAVEAGERSAPERDGDFSCTTTDYSETRQYDRIVAYAANSDSLWPGALLHGASIYDGLFSQASFEREPLSISASLESLDGLGSRLIANPKLSTFRDAIGDILDSEVDGATAANIYAEIEQVHSEKQIELALGASVKWLGGAAGIAGSFNFNDEKRKSRYLVKYVQAYYTVDVDPPGRPSDWFAPSVTAADLEDQFGAGNPPVYVSSITYGRMIAFTFESDYSAKELGAALEFAYKGGVEVTGEVSASSREVLDKSRITAHVLGGSGGEAARSIDSFDGLMGFIREGGNYSKDSPGAPIAYKLNYLANNEPARLSFTDDYQVRECVRVSQKVKVSLDWMKVNRTGGDGAELEVFGNVVATGDSGVTLFDRGEEHAVVINQGETWPQQGVIAEDVIDVTPAPGEALTLRAELKDSDTGWFSHDASIGSEGISIPFEAGWRKQVILHLSGDGAQVDVAVSLLPL
jgi:thiol-activated cytolysin